MFLRKLKRIFMSGVIFVIPLFLLIFITKFILDILLTFVEPIANLLPEGAVFGLGMTRLTSIVILLILILLFGFLARTTRGRRISRKLDAVPGVMVLKTLILGGEAIGEQDFQACLATLDDAWLFAFIMEQHENGMLTVFIPGVPSPTGGSLYFMKEDQIKRLDVKGKEIVKTMMQFGFGSKDLLNNVKW